MFKFKTCLLLIFLFSTTQSFAQAAPKSDAQTAPKSNTQTSAGIQGVTPVGTVVGRYQLFQGTYKIAVIPNGTTVDTQGIIKLDTATGKTWLFFETADLVKSERTRIWLPLEFNYE